MKMNNKMTIVKEKIKHNDEVTLLKIKIDFSCKFCQPKSIKFERDLNCILN